MKRVYFVFGESPNVDNHRILSWQGEKSIMFSSLELHDEIIYDMLMVASPELLQFVRFRNFALSFDQSVRLKDQLFDWLHSKTKERPDAEAGSISVFQIGNRNVFLNMRDIHDSNIHTYWKVYDILEYCIAASKPTFVSLLDEF